MSPKIIRVIRAIRVQKPYASRNSKEYPRPQTEKESVVLSPTSPQNSKLSTFLVDEGLFPPRQALVLVGKC